MRGGPGFPGSLRTCTLNPRHPGSSSRGPRARLPRPGGAPCGLVVSVIEALNACDDMTAFSCTLITWRGTYHPKAEGPRTLSQAEAPSAPSPAWGRPEAGPLTRPCGARPAVVRLLRSRALALDRSEEHTSELQSPCNLVCRLL